MNYEYDALGNLVRKDDVAQNYRYGDARREGRGNAGPHAVTAVTLLDAAVVDDFVYDATGNMLAGNSRFIEYDALGKPAVIREGEPGASGEPGGGGEAEPGAGGEAGAGAIQAWNLGKWLAQLVLPAEVVRWEWKRFRHAFVYLAAEVVKRSRQIGVRFSASHRFLAERVSAVSAHHRMLC